MIYLKSKNNEKINLIKIVSNNSMFTNKTYLDLYKVFHLKPIFITLIVIILKFSSYNNNV
jgi:hypothetical protein